ncbi:MAG: ABC transporter ATP-binding protein [Planctomycetota bacterium]|jgi:putative ABC transport system ATP-binding protein
MIRSSTDTELPELIRLESVWKKYRVGTAEVVALRDVSLTVVPGEFVAVMGVSGSGKSTLLNLLGCLDRPSSGGYSLGGRDVSNLSDNELSEARNLRIGFVFQSFNLIPQLSAVENIEVPLFYRGVPRRLRHPRSRQLGELVGLGDRLEHRPSELSGGEKQRVAIARALANDPLVLLADEPTGNLDSHTSTEILEVFDELHARERTIVMVTHEDHVAAHAKRVVHLADGMIASDYHRAPEAKT